MAKNKKISDAMKRRWAIARQNGMTSHYAQLSESDREKLDWVDRE